MNKELKEKWIKALRSGNYKQGKSCLRTTDNRFCCLGVLCDIVNPDNWRKRTINYGYFKLDATGYIPEELDILDEYTQKDLGARNDCGASFEEIADYIEKNI